MILGLWALAGSGLHALGLGTDHGPRTTDHGPRTRDHGRETTDYYRHSINHTNALRPIATTARRTQVCPMRSARRAPP
jgi:hypothetical protein